VKIDGCGVWKLLSTDDRFRFYEAAFCVETLFEN
jgi:hypothetical protein